MEHRDLLRRPAPFTIGPNVLLALLFAGCGGSGDSGGESVMGTEGPNSGVGRAWISSPSQFGTYTTERSTIRMKGGSFTPPGSTCPSWNGVLPPGFTVTWSNALNGKSGPAFASLNCVTVIITGWDTGDYVPLDLGANSIRVTADDGAGNVGRDTIVVTRVADTTPPTVASASPVDGAMGVGVEAIPAVIFSEGMDPASINAATITLAEGAGLPVSAVVSYDGPTFRATVTPTSLLSISTRYVVTVTTSVRDLAGNPLAAPYVYSFTTGP